MRVMSIDYISISASFLIPGYFIVKDMKVSWGPNVQKHQYYDLLKKYWLIIIIAVVTIITALLMPLIGLCFCCCRCAGACGGRSQPFDKKHDTCRRFLLGLCLVIVACSMMWVHIFSHDSIRILMNLLLDSEWLWLTSTTWHCSMV